MAEINDDIEKYLSGNLSPEEMHALEKKALNDPFLAEAIEGASSISHKDFADDVAGLQQKILERSSKNRWMIPLRIAASVVLLLTASYFIYTFTKQDEPQRIARTESKKASPSPEKSKSDSVSSKENKKPEPGLLTLNQPPPVRLRKKAREELASAPSPTKPTAAASDEKAGQEQLSVADTSHEREVAEAEAKEEPVVEIDKTAKKELAAKSKAKDAKLDEAASSSSFAAGAAAVNSPQKTISGKVTSADDGDPIPGANIIVQGAGTGAVSDVEGNYEISARPAQDSLAISFIGYQTKTVKVPADGGKVDVALPVDATQLSEVVTVAYSIQRDTDDDAPVQLAEPIGGTRAYKKYLDHNLRYPQQALDQKIQGKVTLEFNVGTSGDLSDFKILRGLGYGCDEEVVRLVKDGPAWKPSRKGAVKLKCTIRVGVKFKLPK